MRTDQTGQVLLAVTLALVALSMLNTQVTPRDRGCSPPHSSSCRPSER
ncbi:hypothetical protein [Streptomyces bluensis]|uniref:Uncharacterized protein n=1 Tax=Streptomyces bluensis TaxID=33897 RepID=A0ABW6UI49_9ACTN